MKQVVVKQGKVVVEEVPAPLVEPGTVLVQVDHSCISVGTEMSGVRASGVPLWKKALQKPDQVKKVLEMATTQGISRTRSQIEGKLAAGDPTGYSAAGRVIAIGEGVEDLQLGSRVACAGAQCAHHAEIIRVPRNLAVPVPEGLSLSEASTVTLGAIALQGVRRAQPTLGEAIVVIGLGILGQLAVQLLKANGCRVIGTDVDRKRLDLARSLGMDVGVHPEDQDEIEQVARLTDGFGADGVIITAATPSDEVISTAFRMCRKKGRVVLVGDVGLNLRRGDFYQKELDFFISTSYGPGRYDRGYEEVGLDYPISYVRWTENRNMGAYLRMLAEKKVSVAPLIAEAFPIDEASKAYAALRGEGEKPLMVLLAYPQRSEASSVHVVDNPQVKGGRAGCIRMAVVGAGGFAKGMHLPNLLGLGDRYRLQAIVSRSGHNAQAAARQFGAAYATTDFQAVLTDPEIDAVLISTRHYLHAGMVLAALQAGKHVLVEKPLALSAAEMKEIADFFSAAEDGAPVLLTGFNRRFSAYARRMRDVAAMRSNPMMINYRMNAGHIPLDHWVHGPEGGGRNIGEACHIYDLFTFLTGARVCSVQASSIRPQTGHYSSSDNFVATVSFDDGSLASLTYSALGARECPKEQMDLYVDGKVLVLEDYRRLSVFGAELKQLPQSKTPEKGHLEELTAFAEAIQHGGDWPIPLWQQMQAMDIAFEVESMLKGQEK